MSNHDDSSNPKLPDKNPIDNGESGEYPEFNASINDDEPVWKPVTSRQAMQHTPPPASRDNQLERQDILALVLSFFLPGIGQLYLGQTFKGLAIFAVSIFTCYLGGLLSLGALVDTYLVAMAQKHRTVGDWEFFPDFRKTLTV